MSNYGPVFCSDRGGLCLVKEALNLSLLTRTAHGGAILSRASQDVKDDSLDQLAGQI